MRYVLHRPDEPLTARELAQALVPLGLSAQHIEYVTRALALLTAQQLSASNTDLIHATDVATALIAMQARSEGPYHAAREVNRLDFLCLWRLPAYSPTLPGFSIFLQEA